MEEHKEACLSLSGEAAGSVMWLFNGATNGVPNHLVQNRTEGKRVRRIVRAVKQNSLDAKNDVFVPCKISIKDKDMRYLRDTMESKYDGARMPALICEGAEDLLEAIEKAEDDLIRKRVEAKDGGKITE